MSASNKPKRRKASNFSWKHDVVVPSSYGSTKHDPAKYGTVREPAFHGRPARHFRPSAEKYQKVACWCLERKESLIFGARACAGRCLVEEYALAMACRDIQKVVFVCSEPRLSSRKYKLLKSSCPAGSSVGLLTEETSVDLSNATSIVTTVQTLRRLSYKKAPVLRDVAWIVFDEVLCLGGEVASSWSILEECLLDLDKKVRCLFLTHPLPKLLEFAGWLSGLLDQPCHVIETDHKTAPLKHFGYPMGGEGLFSLKDDVGGFKEDRFKEMISQVRSNGMENVDPRVTGFQGLVQTNTASSVVVDGDGKDLHTHVAEILVVFESQKFLPCAVLYFMPELCAQSAAVLAEKYDFINQAQEKQKTAVLFEQAIQHLDVTDRQLVDAQGLLPYLLKGIGLYHSGMLPVAKEIITLMIEEDVVKVLCATEDYAIVPRLPMRSVVLTSIFKPDGKSRRQMLNPSEYVRLSSLAGRKSDARGYVTCMIDERIECSDCQTLMTEDLEPVEGMLAPSNYTLLNLLRKPWLAPRTLPSHFQKSFADFKHRKRSVELQEQARKLTMQLGGLEGEEEVQQLLGYKELVDKMLNLKETTWARALQPEYSLAFLRPGRLVRVPDGWGVLLRIVRRYDVEFDKENPYLVNVLLKVAGKLSTNPNAPNMEAKPFTVASISAISSLRLPLPDDLDLLGAQKLVVEGLHNLEQSYPDGFPELDIMQDMGLVDPQTVSALMEMEKLCIAIHAHPVHETLKDQNQACFLLTKAEKFIEAEALKKQAAAVPVSKLWEQVNDQLAVLKGMEYITEQGELLKKGVAACEIESVDSLMCVEALSAGVFDGLDKHCLAAVACDFLEPDHELQVSGGAMDRDLSLMSALGKARRVVETVTDKRMNYGQFVDRGRQLEGLDSIFVDMMFAWSKGAGFTEVCNMANAPQGDVTKFGRRLLRLLQELVSCARILGFEKVATSLEDSIQNFARGMMVSLPLFIAPETMVLDP